MGVVSPLGHDADTFYSRLLAGESGISAIETFDASELPTRFAGEIKDFDAGGYISKKMERRLDKYIKYILVAAKQALEHAGVGMDATEGDLDKARCGAVIGSAMGGMSAFAGGVTALDAGGVRKMNPFCIPFSISNMGSAMTAMEVGFMGPNYSIASACASGNYCIQNAAVHITDGDADVMLAGASDAAVLPIGMAGFTAAKALSKRNDDPATASRPWDINRDGFVMGEGAGVLVLEELEHAKARGATIYAEYLGGAYACDAHHMTDPHPDGVGVELCLNKALSNSGVTAADVDYINAHATSTPAGDLAEYGAVSRVFADNKRVKMNSTKSMIGHLLGAAGAVEAVACVKAIHTGLIHPNPNLVDPDPAVDLDLVVGAEQHEMEGGVNVALSSSFGFGGHNSAIVFKAFKE